MSRLGAVLAGGRSSRFGSDKALALLDGARLIDRAVAALAPQCDAVIVVGRGDDRHSCVPDWPRPGMGPLGGLAGALNHALALGHDEVLSCGVDSIGLPGDLTVRLSPAPAYVAAQPVIGLWPAGAAAALKEMLSAPGKHSLKAFAARIGARPIALPHDPANINTRADLERVARRDS